MTSSLSISDVARAGDASPGLVRVDARYLLLTFVPYFVDEHGGVWLERLWHRDFVAHFRYLPHLMLAAPARAREDDHGDPPEGRVRARPHDGPQSDRRADGDLVQLEVPEGATLTLVPLPAADGTLEAVRGLPRLARALWAAIGEADVVHSGVAGWPIPPGWIANPIALLRGRMLVLVIESAPWRLSGTGHERAKDRLREIVTEWAARFFVRRADVNLFTQPHYQRTLARPDARGCHITPAVWIDEGDIVTETEARASWARKANAPVRLLFAARMQREKGVDVLLDALAQLDRRGERARIDVIGEGPRRAACEAAASALRSVELRVLDPVPYGSDFFELVRAHSAVLVPNLGDEQPRILFDAYAQAVPVIAFDTDGLRPYVKHGETGWLVPRGTASLADAIARASARPADLARMGTRALAQAARFTHRGMHEERSRILTRALTARRRRSAFSSSPRP